MVSNRFLTGIDKGLFLHTDYFLRLAPTATCGLRLKILRRTHFLRRHRAESGPLAALQISSKECTGKKPIKFCCVFCTGTIHSVCLQTSTAEILNEWRALWYAAFRGQNSCKDTLKQRNIQIIFWLSGCINGAGSYGHFIIEGSLEVKLPTIWTDEKQSRAEAERRERLEERRSEKRKSQKKEDADARKGRKVAKHCVFSNDLWLRRVEK